VFSILALETGTVPGTVGFGVPESGFEEMRISADPQRGDGRAVLLLACGLDGQAVAIVLARAE
jgi:3-oxoacyl-(acyl-carrier-protein) synthase